MNAVETAAKTVQKVLVLNGDETAAQIFARMPGTAAKTVLRALVGLLQRLLTQTVQTVLVRMLMRLLHRPLLLYIYNQ